jgi:hypothetical protein
MVNPAAHTFQSCLIIASGREQGQKLALNGVAVLPLQLRGQVYQPLLDAALAQTRKDVENLQSHRNEKS